MTRLGVGNDSHATPVAAIVLAAGCSQRMGPQNKLLLPIDGVPMIRRTVLAASASHANMVIVVTGFESFAVRTALERLELTVSHNPNPDQGLSSSLRTGLSGLPDSYAGALICLGDMPLVEAEHMNKLIRAFKENGAHPICVPTCNGKRGNPVLWPAALFTEMKALIGDAGARSLLTRYSKDVLAVEVSSSAVLTDIDTPACLKQLNA